MGKNGIPAMVLWQKLPVPVISTNTQDSWGSLAFGAQGSVHSVVHSCGVFLSLLIQCLRKARLVLWVHVP